LNISRTGNPLHRTRPHLQRGQGWREEERQILHVALAAFLKSLQTEPDFFCETPMILTTSSEKYGGAEEIFF